VNVADMSTSPESVASTRSPLRVASNSWLPCFTQRGCPLGAGASRRVASGRQLVIGYSSLRRTRLTATLVADGAGLPPRSKPGPAVAAGAFGAAGAALALRAS
jgi:hypothetical protein